MPNSGVRTTPSDLPESTAPEGARGPSLRLILIRHGTSTWNDERRIQGQLDPPLSEKGREQARRLGERLNGSPADAFYSSDLLRARETAQAVATGVGRKPQLLPELREVGLGEWEGLRREEIVARYPEEWKSWSVRPDWDLVPGGEGAAAFEARVGTAIDSLARKHGSGTILVVTHGGVIQVALLRIVGRAAAGIFPFMI
ncbi:MAG: histidine phosphatase family protein, partial [Candidatus Dormibacteraeota bacterium]|nr:histidine phosphatase family protein [Candidatus Dormibacteraeota bacterium]